MIDDSVDNVEALCAVLAMMGCLTAVAFGGAQGIAAAERFAPHIAFIDLEMPGMDGCEVARSLREKRPQGSTWLICLTGRGQPGDRRTCMSAGFDDFLTKPMSQERLEDAVAAYTAARFGPDAADEANHCRLVDPWSDAERPATAPEGLSAETPHQSTEEPAASAPSSAAYSLSRL